MSYGYGDWNSGSSRGYEGYGYGYGYGHEGSGGFGFGGSWELGGPEPDGAPEGGDGPGKQRQEPGATGSHGEPEAPPGRGYGAAPDRYDPYESYGDSRVNDHRDPYRAAFDYPGDYPNDYPDYPNDYPNDYPDYPNDYPGDYPNDYPNDYPGDYPDYPNDYPADFPAEPEPDAGDFYGRPHPRGEQQQFPGKFREAFGSRGGWGGRERGFPGFPARGGWAEPRGPPRRLPSLFAHNILPEAGAFPGAFRAFPGAFRGLKRLRRGWKLWDADCRPQRKRPRRDSLGRRRPQPGGSEERNPRTDGSDNSSSDNEEGTEGESGEKEESRGEGEDEEGRDSEKGALSAAEEPSPAGLRPRLAGGRRCPERQKKRHRDRMVERIQFVCSLCKFRTFFEDEIRQHLESKFHREHFQFVGTKLPPNTARFLQEYVANKTRKTEERRRGIRDINAVIQQIQREQDLTQEVGLEHFVRKVEAAHCAACDLLLPMHPGSIQRHLRSPDHNHNRRAMLEQSKRASLAVARSILNNKLIGSKLQSFLKGENPFTDDPEEKEEHEEGEGAGQENPQNLENPKNPEENPENPTENPETSTENPQNLEENPENSMENPQNLDENPENSTENPQNLKENPENSTENPENSTKNLENSTENPQNLKENPENSTENLEKSTENPQNLKENPEKTTKNLENSTENLENSTENPQNLEEKLENSMENPQNSTENPENSTENPPNPEDPEEMGGEKGPGTNPEGENSQNSQNSQNSPNAEEPPEQREGEEGSGMFRQ